MSNAAHKLADVEDCVLVVVDVQEKLFPLMQESDALRHRIGMLMQAAATLRVPIIVTEQYPQGLGRTIPALKERAEALYLEKSTFSCFGDAEFRQRIADLGRKRLVLCGIEAHICVMQTAVEALSAGYDVHLVEDAVSSRLAHAAALGLARMRAAGTTPALAEGVLFEWLRRCDRPEFKAMLPLFKDSH